MYKITRLRITAILSDAFSYCFTKCQNAECHAEGHFAECY
jgi:hypothetical protein